MVMASLKGGSASGAVPATLLMLKVLLRDHLAQACRRLPVRVSPPQVWMKGCDVLRLLGTVLADDGGRADVAAVCETCLPLLFAKCGDANARNRSQPHTRGWSVTVSQGGGCGVCAGAG